MTTKESIAKLCLNICDVVHAEPDNSIRMQAIGQAFVIQMVENILDAGQEITLESMQAQYEKACKLINLQASHVAHDTKLIDELKGNK